MRLTANGEGTCHLFFNMTGGCTTFPMFFFDATWGRRGARGKEGEETLSVDFDAKRREDSPFPFFNINQRANVFVFLILLFHLSCSLAVKRFNPPCARFFMFSCTYCVF